eukprot:scaffold125957_cov21-Phaeocystis_antarctica.AAC.1
MDGLGHALLSHASRSRYIDPYIDPGRPPAADGGERAGLCGRKREDLFSKRSSVSTALPLYAHGEKACPGLAALVGHGGAVGHFKGGARW